MSKYEIRKRQITWAGILLFFGIIIFGRGLKFQEHTASAAGNSVAHLPYKTMYNTIISSDSSNLLLGYELHEDGQYSDGYTTCPEYSAVIKGIDSQKDNYKVLCRDIVSDIVRTCGDRRVVVNIYDSVEAYTLARLYERQYKLLNKEEEDTINNHRVAVYAFADDYNGAASSLTFYPDANNGLSEKEYY